MGLPFLCVFVQLDPTTTSSPLPGTVDDGHDFRHDIYTDADGVTHWHTAANDHDIIIPAKATGKVYLDHLDPRPVIRNSFMETDGSITLQLRGRGDRQRPSGATSSPAAPPAAEQQQKQQRQQQQRTSASRSRKYYAGNDTSSSDDGEGVKWLEDAVLSPKPYKAGTKESVTSPTSRVEMMRSPPGRGVASPTSVQQAAEFDGPSVAPVVQDWVPPHTVSNKPSTRRERLLSIASTASLLQMVRAGCHAVARCSSDVCPCPCGLTVGVVCVAI